MTGRLGVQRERERERERIKDIVPPYRKLALASARDSAHEIVQKNARVYEEKARNVSLRDYNLGR